jgi:hypothetical protein
MMTPYNGCPMTTLMYALRVKHASPSHIEGITAEHVEEYSALTVWFLITSSTGYARMDAALGGNQQLDFRLTLTLKAKKSLRIPSYKTVWIQVLQFIIYPLPRISIQVLAR